MDKESSKSWDDAEKSALVAQIVSGKLSVKSACERHDLSPETIQDWVRVFRRTTLQAFDEHLRQTFLMQGADAAALGSAEYTGTLDDIPIADLIQTFQMGGKGGVITITRDGQHSHIWCDRGEIIDAESGPLRGESAIYRILNFERGQVLADFHSEPRERTIDLPGNVLLLEAARRKDESARLLERLGDDRAVYRPGSTPAPGSNEAERGVLALCDGELSLKQVLERSDLGELETLSVISNLVERQQLVQYGVSIAPPSASTAITISNDTPHDGVSFLPLVASQRAEPRKRARSPLAFAGAGVVLGTTIWALVSLWPQGTREAARRAAPPAPALPRTFLLDSSVEPSQAELWLDGVRLGVGRLRQELPRDGAPHSLRIAAEGYAPTTLLFVDAPPPPHIALEPLGRAGSDRSPSGSALDDVAPGSAELAPRTRPAARSQRAPSVAAGEHATPERLAPGGTAPADSLAAAASAASGSGPRRPPAARPKRAAAPSASRPLAEPAAPAAESDVAAGDEPPRAPAPRIQIIEDHVPTVQVIE